MLEILMTQVIEGKNFYQTLFPISFKVTKIEKKLDQKIFKQPTKMLMVLNQINLSEETTNKIYIYFNEIKMNVNII